MTIEHSKFNGNSNGVYELSLKEASKKNVAVKPQKLKPLNKSNKNNLAVSLLENDFKTNNLEGIPSTADLDKEIKEYLDANKIIKQLKSAFNTTSSDVMQ